jgi:glycosyltransferase involved in cell wall biosynthesis
MKLSIAVTAFNHEKYIARAIEGILMQEVDFDYEIIVGEDCSADETRRILIDFQNKYPDKIKLILPQQNQGLRGVGIFLQVMKECTGDYVALLDGDDHWTSPFKLRKQVSFLDQHPECAMCFHNTRIVYEDDGEVGSWNLRVFEDKQVLTTEDILANCSIQTSTMMLRKEVFSRQLEKVAKNDYFMMDDWSISALLSQHNSIGYHNDVMGIYRQHDSGSWSKRNRAEKLRYVVERYEWVNSLLAFAYDKEVKHQIAVRCYDLAMAYEEIGDYKNASTHLQRCIAERPRLLEEYLPGKGYKGPRVWKFLHKKLWLYRHPILCRLSKHGMYLMQPVRATAAAFRLCHRMLSRSLRGNRIGILWAVPNPAKQNLHSGLSSVTLLWVTNRQGDVQIRLGAPDGPLFSVGGTSGAAATGQWVHDTMHFYLQDANAENPLSPKNTLDVLTVNMHKGKIRTNIVKFKVRLIKLYRMINKADTL